MALAGRIQVPLLCPTTILDTLKLLTKEAPVALETLMEDGDGCVRASYRRLMGEGGFLIRPSLRCAGRSVLQLREYLRVLDFQLRPRRVFFFGEGEGGW